MKSLKSEQTQLRQEITYLYPFIGLLTEIRGHFDGNQDGTFYEIQKLMNSRDHKLSSRLSCFLLSQTSETLK